ncbi:MAG: HDIG domain-containing metalloprotein [Dehalococcoidia bacterium]
MIVNRPPSSISGLRILFFVVALGAVLAFILFPFSPAAADLKAGDRAEQTLVAPEDLTFESTVQTEARRARAAAAIEQVIELDPGIRDEQLTALDTFLRDVDEIRESGSTLNQQQTSFRDLGQASLSDTDGVIILELTGEEWTSVQQEARRLLGEAMSESVTEEQLPAVQEGLRGRVASGLSSRAAAAATEIVTAFVTPNVVLNEAATNAAVDAAVAEVDPVTVELNEGEVIVRQGDIITDSVLEKLTTADLLETEVDIGEVIGVTGISLLAAAAIGAYLLYLKPVTLASDRRIVMVLLVVATVVLAAKLYLPEVLPDSDRRFLMLALPVALAPMLVAALFEDSPFAITVAAVTAALCAFTAYYLPEAPGVVPGRPLDALALFFGYFSGSLVGVFAVNRASALRQYFLAGLLVTVSTAAAASAFVLLDPAWEAEDFLWVSLSSAGGGIFSAVLTLGAFVLLGTVFGVTTRLQLMEFAELNHPLIRRLQDEAPGTFHHSVLVSNLAQAAANAVGADALQARIGAYFHDIGKLAKPRFYIENMTDGVNPHDELEPAASARIVSDHVRNGMDLARKQGVPQVLRDYIPQHHGTRLVTFFYRKAVQAGAGSVNPEPFRYPGPKPQRRETAIVMLADSIEATVRARDDKSPEAIDFVVEGTIRERLQEGQLDESDLTLRDLQRVAEAFRTTLRGVYHQRIEYPAPTEAEEAALQSGGENRPDPFSNLT